MKIAVFGATGRTGIPLIEQALAAGHEVVAFVRNPAKMSIKHDCLSLVPGDAMNAADVEKAIVGVEAVISTLGHDKNSPHDMQTVATQNIVQAMEKHQVKRLISLTGAGLAAPQDQPKLINHLIKFALKTMAGHVLKDAEGHAQIIENSALDWVIVRGPRLTEGEFTGKYRVGWVGVNTSSTISRADLADFMLKHLNDNTYLHQMPMVSD